MTDTARLLEIIEEGIIAHGGDLGGWTRNTNEMLQIFDGRVTLRCEVQEIEPPCAGKVHAHILATLHEHDDEVLDACIFGMADNRKEAFGQAAMVWIMAVAGPIKSFIDCKPICMTCQAGVEGGDSAQGYSQGDYGLPNLHAYVGPAISRNISSELISRAIDDTKPWFRFAAESASPRRVHLAKSIIVAHGTNGWHRDLEVDGHDVYYHEDAWPAGVEGPESGYFIRFVVFEYPRNSREIARRSELERAIRYFAEHYCDHEILEPLLEDMIRQGFNAELVDEVESFSTIAFGRYLFESYGVNYPSSFIWARRNGNIEMDIPLMSMPAYARARVITAQLCATMPADQFRTLCMYSAESQVILNAMNAEGDKLDFSKITMFPCVVPEHGVSRQTMDAAIEKMNDLVKRKHLVKKKSWWKFW
jgi:hypothetical protein